MRHAKSEFSSSGHLFLSDCILTLTNTSLLRETLWSSHKPHGVAWSTQKIQGQCLVQILMLGVVQGTGAS